jgi:hypothetical protein
VVERAGGIEETMIVLDITIAEAWNLLAIACLVLGVGYNLFYFFTHANGKRLIRLWAAIVLAVSLGFRIVLALRIIDTLEYSTWVRPWVGLVYLIPAMDAFVDWHRKS